MKKFLKELLETVKFVILALIIVLPIRFFIAQPFLVSGASMYPTFHNGDYLIVDQLSYRIGEVERNDVIVFKYPEDTSKFFIKRVIGLPNETIEIKKDSVIIKNEENKDGFILDQSYLENQSQKENREDKTYTLKDNEYFVMGDNRGASHDSRAWGSVPRNLIMGKPFLRLFPFDSISYKPGLYEMN